MKCIRGDLAQGQSQVWNPAGSQRIPTQQQIVSLNFQRPLGPAGSLIQNSPKCLPLGESWVSLRPVLLPQVFFLAGILAKLEDMKDEHLANIMMLVSRLPHES